LIEIGSSDGSETVSFLRYKLHRKSTIYEPRASAISKISTRFRFRLLKRRASLQQYLVVANERDSQNFVNLKKGNLSHIQLSKTNEKLQKKTNSNYITFQEVLAKHLFKPTLIKMDLEGYEFELLQTLAENLTLEKSVSFIIELHQKEYNLDRVKMIVNAMFQSGFKIECVETATNPKPMLLNDILYPMPLFVSSRRALYCVKHQEISPDKLIELIFGQNFVCNPKTSEFGYRLVRTVVISKDIKFMMRESRSIRSFAWKKYYKI
jgi:FkbM family methyltransferase